MFYLLERMRTQSYEMLKDSCVSFLGLQGLRHFGNAGELPQASVTVAIVVKQGLPVLGAVEVLLCELIAGKHTLFSAFYK